MSQDPYSSPSEGAQAGAYQQPSQQPAYGYAPPPPAAQAAPDKVKRFVAVLIDGIIVAVISQILSAIVPIVGAAVGLALYLARDAALDGQSPGKKVMGLRAVTASGGKVTINESVRRNATLSISYLYSILGTVPVLAILALPLLFLGAAVSLYECYLVLTDKPRVGDNIAHTHVITEGAQPAVA